MSTELNLPKGYLSYSAMELWRHDPVAYRKRYYEGEPYFSTPYTEFGNKVGGALEELTPDGFEKAISFIPGGEHLHKVERYSKPEYKVTVDILGVPVLMYLDSFEPTDNAILEYKTGIKSKAGKDPWDRVKVRKHKQLTIYSLGIRELHGAYNPDIKLIWMETKWSQVTAAVEFGSKTFQQTYTGLKLTGHVETFHRRIEDWELDRTAEIIRATAEQISEDYTIWLKQQEENVPFL